MLGKGNIRAHEAYFIDFAREVNRKCKMPIALTGILGACDVLCLF